MPRKVSDKMKYEYNIIVVGDDHGGSEAALASARIAKTTILITSNKNNKRTYMYCYLIKKNPNKITLKIDRFEIWKFSNNRKETYIKSFPLRDF